MNYLTVYRRLDRENLLRAAARRILRSIRSLKSVYRHLLNASAPAAAVLNYSVLKFRQMLTGTVAVPYIGEAKLLWPKGATSVAIQAKYGLGEFRDMAFLLHMLRSEDLFADVGANAGVYTILASKSVGARVVAIEPVPTTFDLLRRNVELNNVAGTVDLRQCGVGRHSTDLHFTASLWSFNHVAEHPGDDTVEVPIEPLDTILAGRVPRLIKIDVEGFEGEVVAGAAQTLANPDCVVVIMEVAETAERYGASGYDIIRQMEDFGFLPYWYDPFRRTLAVAGLAKEGRWNKIFIRDMAFVKERIETAPSFDIRGVRV